KIKFELASNSFVKLKIYDVLGREKAVLINDNQTAGEHEVIFNAKGLSSGIYFYKLEANGANGSQYSATKKMILIK
ncbi:MAG: T9SS type A sorting domain-containing protein, partial [Bacteroidota bacterium]|nr:T9SS type A sorting domain-containing protein [Bacteroidota bacterium]